MSATVTKRREWRIGDFVHIREDLDDGDKRVWWQRLDGTPGFPEGVGVRDLPLYGADQLNGSGPRVAVCEGEKATDALLERGVVAAGTVTGASSIPGDAALRVLMGYPVVLWPDNDYGGAKHMSEIAKRLWALGHRQISVVAWTESPEKGDAADFDGDNGALEELLASAWDFIPDSLAGMIRLLDDVRDFIRRYVVLEDAQLDAIALWVAHTHAIGAVEMTPYLVVTSATKRAGKSRLVEVLSLVAARPWSTSGTTTAALYRKLDDAGSTLLLDEADTIFKGDKERAQALLGVLNSGYQRGGTFTTCIGTGANMKTYDFSTFGPKVIAGIGGMPETIEDRAIRIIMKRRAVGESIERYRRRGAKELGDALRARLAQWADDVTSALAEARPEIPDHLDDRAADGWEALLAIADMAGGDWPERGRSAALALSAGDGREDDGEGVRLLQDIRAVFESEGVGDRLFSKTLARLLSEIEEAPWGDIWGKPLDATGLAKRLKPFAIKSRSVRLGDETAKGYYREWFDDAWVRYLPRKGVTSVTSVTIPSAKYEQNGSSVTAVTAVTANRGVRAGRLARYAVEQLGLNFAGNGDGPHA